MFVHYRAAALSSRGFSGNEWGFVSEHSALQNNELIDNDAYNSYIDSRTKYLMFMPQYYRMCIIQRNLDTV